MPLRGAAAAGRVARCAVRAHHKRHTNTKKSQLRQRHSAATQPPPTATTAPVPFPHHRRSNQAPCFEARQPLLHPPRKTKVAKSPQPQEPPAAPQHPPTAARGAGVGTQPPRPPHQATHRPERPTFYSHSPFPPATPRCWSCLPLRLALVVVVGAARATAPVADPGWVPGLVSRLDGQHEVLGEAGLLCRRR